MKHEGTVKPAKEYDQPNVSKDTQKLSDILRRIADDPIHERISIRMLFDVLGDRAFGALMLVFAIPNCLPTPPGTSAILGAPLIFLTLQLMLGMKPWLPKFIADRSLARADFARIIDRANPWLAYAERLLRQRLTFLTQRPAEYVIGFLCFVMAIVLTLPIPLGNMPTAFAICLFSFGILERDGVWILAGLAVFAGSLFVAGSVVYGFIKASIFVFARVFV
ncbi:MAG: hypothetical protein RIR97_263 [Pseudomonadota bacterium]